MRIITGSLILLLAFVTAPSHTYAQNGDRKQLTISGPKERIVYQRDNNNTAKLPVKGSCPADATVVLARLVAREKGQGTTTPWKEIDRTVSTGEYSGILEGTGGWYDLEVCVKRKNRKVGTARLERVGIGEVFLVVGHSVAQGAEEGIEGSADDRVSVIPLVEKSDTFQMYLKTGDMKYLPEPHFVKADSGVAPAPFAHGNYFWSKFGELIARKQNVPVLIMNAAFGGSALEHWAKSTQHIPFEHGFVKWEIRMPYINVYNALKKYVSITGIRALLSDHGTNDGHRKSADTIFNNYKTFVEQTRKDLGYEELAIVVNSQAPPHLPFVRVAQERMLKEKYSFPGPDYDKMMKEEDRPDKLHLGRAGMKRAAVLWADALTPEFFKQSKPWQPTYNAE